MNESTNYLHIAYLVQQFPPEIGAGPARVTEMAHRWMAAGARVTVITGMPSRSVAGRGYGEGDPKYHGRAFLEEEWEGIRVLRSWLFRARRGSPFQTILNNSTFMLTSALHATTSLRSPEVLIASSPPFFPHISGALVASLRGIPLVLEIRDLWPDYLVGLGILREGHPATKALFALERRLLKRATHVVVVTESFKRRVIQKGVPTSRITVIPNGVDVESYYQEVSSPPLEALKREPGGFVVGYLGSFGAGQQLESIVDAAAIIAAHDPSIRIVLAGDGPRRDSVLERAKSLKLPNLHIESSIPKEATRAFYNSCDACMVPLAPIAIFQETIPSKMFEIMACERPIIACLAGEGRQIVAASNGGIVAQPGEASAIAEAILSMRRMSAGERMEMGASAREYVLRNYRREVLADKYLALLAATVSRSRSRNLVVKDAASLE